MSLASSEFFLFFLAIVSGDISSSNEPIYLKFGMNLLYITLYRPYQIYLKILFFTI